MMPSAVLALTVTPLPRLWTNEAQLVEDAALSRLLAEKADLGARCGLPPVSGPFLCNARSNAVHLASCL